MAKKKPNLMNMTVAEYFADNGRAGEFGAWLWRAGLDAAGIAKFAQDWWLLVTLSGNKLLDGYNRPDVCDLDIEESVLETLRLTLKTLFSHPSQHAAFVKHFSQEFADAIYYGDEDVYLPEQIMSWESLYRQFAEVYSKWYLFAGEDFGWEIEDKLVPHFRYDEDVLFLMYVSHGLIQDHPHNPLGYPGMPKFRWAFNGKEWAWHEKKACIFQGQWLTVKHYEAIQMTFKVKGF